MGSESPCFFPRSKIAFFHKRAFLDHLSASKYLNWLPAGKGVAQDPRVVCIKGSVQFRFCKKWSRSVWVFPLQRNARLLSKSYVASCPSGGVSFLSSVSVPAPESRVLEGCAVRAATCRWPSFAVESAF